MVLSGFLLNYAYLRYRDRTQDSERPSLLTKITEPEVELLTADGELRNLQELKGQVTLVMTLSMDPQEESRPSLEALSEVMESFQGAEQKPRILVFVLDASNAEPEKMKSLLSEYGEEPEVLRVVASEEGKSSLRSFLKAKMRFNITPTEKEGKFVYDSRIVLLDQHLHVRGWPGFSRGWDFERVARFERERSEALETHPESEVRPLPMSTPLLRKMLIHSIKYLYENPDEKGQK